MTINAFAACNLVWCGNGDCIVSGNSHYCQCNQGSANYLDDASFACFEPCKFLIFVHFRQCKCHMDKINFTGYFGEDCRNLELGPLPRLPPPLHLPPPLPSLQLPPPLPSLQQPPPLPLPPPSSTTSSGSPKAGREKHEADTEGLIIYLTNLNIVWVTAFFTFFAMYWSNMSIFRKMIINVDLKHCFLLISEWFIV